MLACVSDWSKFIWFGSSRHDYKQRYQNQWDYRCISRDDEVLWRPENELWKLLCSQFRYLGKRGTDARHGSEYPYWKTESVHQVSACFHDFHQPRLKPETSPFVSEFLSNRFRIWSRNLPPPTHMYFSARIFYYGPITTSTKKFERVSD